MGRLITLTQCKVALVDEDDFERLSAFKWCATRHRQRWYAVRRATRVEGGMIVRMHRQVLDAPSGLDVDHIDGDGLNNRRSNLRVATRLENARNQVCRRGGTSTFKGVSRSGTRRWRATIRLATGRLHLGYFDSEEDAAKTYDVAAREHFGSFASLNFPADGG